MSLKFKALGGLAALASMGIAGFAAINASATVSGHFIHDAVGGHALVNQKSSAESTHAFVFKIDNQSVIKCDEFSAFGTVTTATVQQVSGSTTFVGCRTEGEASGTIAVHTNGCTGTGFSNSTGAVTGGLDCPAGKTLVVTHPNCTINVPPQANVSGFTVTQITLAGKHAITLDANVQYTIHYESGVCIFLGTKHTMFITGSTVIRGTDTEGTYINITST